MGRTLLMGGVFVAAIVMPATTLYAAEADTAESLAAYAITARAAADILPEPIRPFFSAYLEALRQAALRPSPGAHDDGDGDQAGHFVMIDAAAATFDAASRQKAARQFPRDKGAALRLFRQHRIKRGGVLPWLLLDRHAALQAAFAAADATAIVAQAGALIHLTTDACLPLNTTADPDGRHCGALTWSGGHLAAAAHRTVRHRLQARAIDRLQPRLDAEVQIWSGRVHAVADPVSAVFDALLESNGVIDELLGVDRWAVAKLGLSDADSFLAEPGAYYDAIAPRIAPILESRLEAGAVLAAELIASAWTQAGTPASSSFREVAPSAPEVSPASSTPSPLPAPRGPTGLVASRSSTKYHRLTCPHVVRIKPKNMIRFASEVEARATGRTACKRCKPAEPLP